MEPTAEKLSEAVVTIPDDLSVMMAQVAIDTNRTLSCIYRVALRNYLASRSKGDVDCFNHEDN